MQATESAPEQLALVGELAASLVHETNNFLNSVLLQLALSLDELPEPQRGDWMRIREEGRCLSRLLREWQGWPRPSVSELEKIDLSESVRDGIAGLWPGEGSARPRVTLAADPLWLTGPRGLIGHFCRLLLQHAIGVLESAGQPCDRLLVRTERLDDAVLLKLSQAGPEPWSLDWLEFESSQPRFSSNVSLVGVTCQSLARRLNARIGVQGASRPSVLAIEWRSI